MFPNTWPIHNKNSLFKFLFGLVYLPHLSWRNSNAHKFCPNDACMSSSKYKLEFNLIPYVSYYCLDLAMVATRTHHVNKHFLISWFLFFSRSCAMRVVSNHVYLAQLDTRRLNNVSAFSIPWDDNNTIYFIKSTNGFDVLCVINFSFRTFWGTSLCVYFILRYHSFSIDDGAWTLDRS